MNFPPLTNCALLDPPRIFSGQQSWYTNWSPTTSFRHGRKNENAGSAVAAGADGNVRGYRAQADWIISPEAAVGSVGRTNAPHYVPDAAAWRR